MVKTIIKIIVINIILNTVFLTSNTHSPLLCMGLGRAVHGMFIPELPAGICRQISLYIICLKTSRFFDEKGYFHVYFVRDFLITLFGSLTEIMHAFLQHLHPCVLFCAHG